MSDVVTGDQTSLTAWQRWELPAFESDPNSVRANLPTALELEQMQQQAREEAAQTGYEEGLQRGYAEGLQRAVDENAQLLELAAVLCQQMDDRVVQELTGLALDVARLVIRQALKVQPELLQAAVHEAIGSLPLFNQAAHVILNPQDAALLRERMGEQLAHTGWKILEDVHMTRGDARLETANSQVDVTLAERWARVMAAMGQDAPWLVQEEQD